PWGQAQPFELLISDLAETVAPSDARIAAALNVPGVVTSKVPGGVTGVLEGQTPSRYRFTAKKGERFAIAVEALRLGSGLDALLVLRGPDGKELARGDDLPGTTDPRLDFTVPADGQYELAVSDLAGVSRSRAAAYRLVVQAVEDDFHLSAAAQRLSVPIGQK